MWIRHGRACHKPSTGKYVCNLYETPRGGPEDLFPGLRRKGATVVGPLNPRMKA